MKDDPRNFEGYRPLTIREANLLGPDEWAMEVVLAADERASIFFNQGDRETWEHSLSGHSKVLAPHPAHGDNTPRHLRIEGIMKRLKCEPERAARFRDFLVAIEATAEMSDTIIRWSLLTGTGKLTEREEGEYAKLRGCYQQLLDLPKLPPEKDIALHYRDLPSGTEPEAQKWRRMPLDGSFCIINPAERPDYPDPVLEENPEFPEKVGAVPDAIEYHPIAEFDPPAKDWLSQQPKWYRTIIAAVKVADWTSLASLGKAFFGYTRETWANQIPAHFTRKDYSVKPHKPGQTTLLWAMWYGLDVEGKDLSKYGSEEEVAEALAWFNTTLPPFKDEAQAQFFWSRYNIRKNQLDPQQPAGIEQLHTLIERVQATRTIGELRALRAKMEAFKLHHLRNCRMGLRAWKNLWAIYSRHLAHLQGKDELPALKLERLPAPKRIPAAERLRKLWESKRAAA